MNVVQNQWQPRVVHIRFPLTRNATRDVIDTYGFAKSFPILAVTRSKTMPCGSIAKSPRHRGTASRQNSNSNKNSDKEKQRESMMRHSASGLKDSTNEKGDDEKSSSEKDQSHHDRRRSSSLPVWPVTNPSTIAKMSESSYKELPKPKLNVDWSGWKPARKPSLANGASREATPTNNTKTNGSAKSEIRKNIVRINPPPRSCTPMSEYDPDRLNIKHVVKFLDTQDEEISRHRPDSRREVPVSRPRPFTVAHTESQYGSRVVKSAHSVHKGVRRSPIAARRFMKSARSHESNNRDLAVSPFGMSEKRTVSRREIKQQVRKMNRLASLAARYSPEAKGGGTKPAEKTRESGKEETVLLFKQNTGGFPEQYIGRLKHKSATFHSFPTNCMEENVEETGTSEKADDNAESVEVELDTDRSAVVPDKQRTIAFADTNSSTFNAINAIRLPSVFDNVDLESESGWVPNESVVVSKQFQTMTVSGPDKALDQEQEALNSNSTSRSTSRTTSREKNRHNRHLSMVFSRERSADRSWSIDHKHKHWQTGNWVKACAEEQTQKVIELKLTHGSPRT